MKVENPTVYRMDIYPMAKPPSMNMDNYRNPTGRRWGHQIGDIDRKILTILFREQILESIVHIRHAKELYQTRAFAGKFLWTHWANKVNRGMVLDLVGQWFIALNTLERKKRPCYP